jgi:methylenetetrahydrofolate reductase (NADPH)
VNNPFAFHQDKKLTDVLSAGRFTLSAEIIPPRNGAMQAKILNDVGSLIRAGAQFLAVTKGAGGSLRGGSLPIAHAIKDRFGVPCVAHFTCRDLLITEIENQLIDYHYFGIRNILALRGDPPDGQPSWKARDGGYDYAYQLIEQIRRLNQGEYLARENAQGIEAQAAGRREATDFCIGAAVYPDASNGNDRVDFFKRKVVAGAHYGITDMLFDPESYARFMDECARAGLNVPVLPGTRVLRSRDQVDKMVARFKVKVPRAYYDGLDEHDSNDAMQKGVDLFLQMTEKLRSYGAPGVHIFVIGDVAGACAALTGLAWQEKKSKSFLIDL